nr:hypothetical protein [Mycobacterium sp.]
MAEVMRRRVHRRDRDWAHVSVELIFGPLDMPSTDALRQAVTMLTDKHPHCRLAWRMDADRRCWRNDRSSESIVVEREWPQGQDVSAQLRVIADDPDLEAPLTLIRYPNHVGLKISHGLGDANIFLAAFCGPICSAMLGTALDWPIEPAPRLPLLRAVLGTFGAKPAALKAAFADRPTPTADVDTGALRPWQPSQCTTGRHLSPEEIAQIYRWRDQFAPGTSTYALQIALVLRGLRGVGLEVCSEVRMVSDLRRYLGWHPIDGNFTAGVPMRIEAGMEAAEISARIRATNASGRPLAGYTLGALNRSRSVQTATSARDGALPRIAFSSLGMLPIVEGLPILPGQQREFTGSVSLDGPQGISVLTAQTSQSMHITATFHDNVIDPALMDAALDIIASDPVGLLSGAACEV